MDVTRIVPEAADRLRATRLAALLDAPGAFARTYADEVDLPAVHWETMAHTRSSGCNGATFVVAGAATQEAPRIGRCRASP